MSALIGLGRPGHTRLFARERYGCAGYSSLRGIRDIADERSVQNLRCVESLRIDLALGAGRRSVLWLVLKDVLLLVGAGIEIGVPAALGADQLIETLLYGLEPADPTVILISTALLVAVAICAGYLLVRRAARVVPMVALRYE